MGIEFLIPPPMVKVGMAVAAISLDGNTKPVVRGYVKDVVDNENCMVSSFILKFFKLFLILDFRRGFGRRYSGLQEKRSLSSQVGGEISGVRLQRKSGRHFPVQGRGCGKNFFNFYLYNRFF